MNFCLDGEEMTQANYIILLLDFFRHEKLEL